MESYILFYIQLKEHANTELKKDEVYMLCVGLQTSLSGAKAKLTRLPPTCIVKACAKNQFLEDIDEQCRGLCVQELKKTTNPQLDLSN